jgi:bacteriocin-like protein
MDMHNFKTIDDSALEAVSGGHGQILAKVAERIEAGIDKFADFYGNALQKVGDAISGIGKRIAD